MNPELTREKVLEQLRQIQDPEAQTDVVSARKIEGIVVRGNKVGFMVLTTPAQAANAENLRAACEAAVAKLPGVDQVTAVLTAEKTAETAPAVAPAKDRAKAVWNREPVPGIRHILLVASGKGGVGKSTVAVCLAHALAQQGQRVGLLDADIYGPSIPTMMGLSGEPKLEENQMVPHEKEGIACMSMGFLLGDNAAVMRAPMVTKALHQLLRQVKWEKDGKPLDVLVVDMPPGTGDIQLSMAQQAPVGGVVIVTTPQEVAVADARKGIDAFRKLGIPVLGVLENMSGFIDSAGNEINLFGKGGGSKLAKQTSTLFLGELALLPEMGRALDQGQTPQLPQVMQEIAVSVMQQLQHLKSAH